MSPTSAGRRREGPEDPHPDPTHDTWSAWLPQLDGPGSRPTQPTEATAPPDVPVPPPPASAMPAPSPSTRYAGSPAHAPAPPVRRLVLTPPPNRVLPAILCTFLCFLPFGIVALVRGSSVNRLWALGRYEEASRASRSARNWCIAAAVVWPGSGFLFAFFGMLWWFSLVS